MDVILSKNAGFCPGVRRADDTVRSLISSSSGDDLIYTLGDLIHNDHYNNELKMLGVSSIEPQEIPKILADNPKKQITLVIRTHGIQKHTEDYLKKLSDTHGNLKLIDMTCPYVKRIHKIADENTSENTHFILFGSNEHPEVQGIISYAKGKKSVISSLEEAESLEIGDKIPILCSQTTQNLLLFVKIKNFFKKRFTNAQIFDTICSVTENRQSEAIDLARECDMMIVIGGLESSNTRKLFELCKKECENTHWIQAKDCPPIATLGDVKKVGITAGASTPDGIILEVYKSYGKL